MVKNKDISSLPSELTQFLAIHCAGCDKNIMKKMPNRIWIKYARIGGFVLLTSIFAFIAAFYAVNEIFKYIVIAIAIGFLWSIMIFNLDQFLVISNHKKEKFSLRNLANLMIRLLMAMVLAFTISKPFEVRFFDDLIQEKLNQQISVKCDSISKNKNQKIKSLQDELNDNIANNNSLQIDYLREYAGGGSKRDGFSGNRGAGPQSDFRRKIYEEDSVRLVPLKKEYKDKILRLGIERDSVIKVTKEIQAKSFFGKYKTLEILSDQDKSISNASWFILLFFMIIETMPILSKALSERDDYDIAIELEKDKLILEKKKIDKKNMFNIECFEESLTNLKAKKKKEFIIKGLKKSYEKILDMENSHIERIKDILKSNSDITNTQKGDVSNIANGKLLDTIKNRINDFFS